MDIMDTQTRGSYLYIKRDRMFVVLCDCGVYWNFLVISTYFPFLYLLLLFLLYLISIPFFSFIFCQFQMIEQKGMTFDHDFAYSFPLFSSLLKKREEEKENELAKIVIKGHAFLLDHSKYSKLLILVLYWYFSLKQIWYFVCWLRLVSD